MFACGFLLRGCHSVKNLASQLFLVVYRTFDIWREPVWLSHDLFLPPFPMCGLHFVQRGNRYGPRYYETITDTTALVQFQFSPTNHNKTGKNNRNTGNQAQLPGRHAYWLQRPECRG